MAAVMAIIFDNLQLKYPKSMCGLEYRGLIFFIFYMKLTYNSATKTHIFPIFQKSIMAAIRGDNYR